SPTNNRQRRKCKENVANYRVVMNENGEYRLVMREKENVEDLQGGPKLDGNVNKMNKDKEESGERRKSKKFLRHKSGGNYTKPSFFGLLKPYHHDSIPTTSSTSHTESYQDLPYCYSYDDEPSHQEPGPFSQSHGASNKKRNNKHELRRHSAGCGTIDFEEFIGSLNIKSEDLEDRLQWLFRFYDQDSDGLITRDEMLQIMYAIYN
ncbi:522_t:CDS:2, partial [Acaulospora morrowiae]